jgi:transposase
MANNIPYLIDKKSRISYTSCKRRKMEAAEMVGTIMYGEIQKLKSLGYKKQRAARQLSIDTKTVRKYWDMTEEEYATYLLECKERLKIMDAYHDFVLDRLKLHSEITSAIIFDNLREEFTNFSPSYRSVRLYVCNLREKEGIPAPLKVRQYGENPELPFGFQAQVDMGQKIMKDSNGKSIKVYIFAMVMSSSRYKYTTFQLEPFTAQTFVIAHDRAFRYFGGRPVEIVYDQDRVMVVSENGGDIIFTQTFETYKNYAGFSVHLCRGADPESKGKIEAVVKYVKNNFLSCRTFHGLARLNSDGLAWLDRTGNGLVHDTTKMIPAVVFEQEQKHLKSVPELSEPMVIPKIAIVRKNNIVMYRQNRYTMPIGTYQPGRTVRIEADEDKKIIRFLDFSDNSLIEEHRIHQGSGKCIRNTHPERDRVTKYNILKQKVISGFNKSDVSEKFIENILLLKPRYVRDQLSIIAKLQEQYSKDELDIAMNYCMERQLFSASDFKDTLEYFSKKQDMPIIKSTRIPFKYSLIVAQTRSIDVYANIFMGGQTR